MFTPSGWGGQLWGMGERYVCGHTVQMDGCGSCGGRGRWMWGHMMKVGGCGVTSWCRWMDVGSLGGGGGWMWGPLVVEVDGCGGHDCRSGKEEEMIVE